MVEAKILWVGVVFDVSNLLTYKQVLKLPSNVTYSNVAVYTEVMVKIDLVDEWGKRVLIAGKRYDFATVQDLPTDNVCLIRFVQSGLEVLILRIKKTTMPAWTLVGRLLNTGVVDSRTPEELEGERRCQRKKIGLWVGVKSSTQRASSSSRHV